MENTQEIKVGDWVERVGKVPKWLLPTIHVGGVYQVREVMGNSINLVKNDKGNDNGTFIASHFRPSKNTIIYNIIQEL